MRPGIVLFGAVITAYAVAFLADGFDLSWELLHWLVVVALVVTGSYAGWSYRKLLRKFEMSLDLATYWASARSSEQRSFLSTALRASMTGELVGATRAFVDQKASEIPSGVDIAKANSLATKIGGLTLLFVASTLYMAAMTANIDAIGHWEWYGCEHTLPHGTRVLSHLYFSAVTLSTIGYGDMAPHTWQARLIAYIQAVAYVGVFGVVVQILLNKVPCELHKAQTLIRSLFRLTETDI
jgi:ion channel